jgi:hypothetical protein
MKEIDRRRGVGCCCFYDGDMTMAMLMMAEMVTTMKMIDYCLLLESDRRIAAIIYFLFIFNDNARENLLARKVIGGGRGKVG